VSQNELKSRRKLTQREQKCEEEKKKYKIIACSTEKSGLGGLKKHEAYYLCGLGKKKKRSKIKKKVSNQAHLKQSFF